MEHLVATPLPKPGDQVQSAKFGHRRADCKSSGLAICQVPSEFATDAGDPQCEGEYLHSHLVRL